MNTRSEAIPILPQTGEYDVFVLEDLELVFSKKQLKGLTKMWNGGSDMTFIAKQYKRDPDEIFLALFHQSRKGKIRRPFFNVNKSEGGSLLVPGSEQN